MKLFLIAVLGVLMHIVFKFINEYTNKRKTQGTSLIGVFKGFDWEYQCVLSLQGLFVVAVVVYFKDRIIDMLNLDLESEFTELVIFFCGYFFDSVWKNIEFWGKKTIKSE